MILFVKALILGFFGHVIGAVYTPNNLATEFALIGFLLPYSITLEKTYKMICEVNSKLSNETNVVVEEKKE